MELERAVAQNVLGVWTITFLIAFALGMGLARYGFGGNARKLPLMIPLAIGFGLAGACVVVAGFVAIVPNPRNYIDFLIANPDGATAFYVETGFRSGWPAALAGALAGCLAGTLGAKPRTLK